jgi:ribosome-associated toxin RatA of RatAB toxin-antitoxin module
MNSKTTLTKICKSCESQYKLVFNQDEVSGYPKFCPFCGDEDYDEEEDEVWEE